ncbi:von Willebrand factor type A domain protein [Candidatus Sulfotelmatomonas gaucii]|uniref:von Willebrand factor type A domain protein n=1 Tax=Candidatus Sulfuritelmatomonas gaucii TaxID=2043161 RepID=A0A2N9LLV3_9BACT|nr:von Willebrand factor type A domain protein [Candidatus Sulfotelmatomonas gaucii]
MDSTLPLNLHHSRFALLVALAMLACSGPFSYSQAFGQQMPAASNSLNDPTRPEAQPPLDVDRDPIPSPDITVNPPASIGKASAPNAEGSAKVSGSSSVPANPNEIQKQQNGMYILHANVDEVLLNCAVIDEKGRPVMDLDRSDFRVWENGVLQTVNSVQHMDLPVSMGILIDDSGSMRDKRNAVNAAAIHLLNASNPSDEAFVVNFSDRAYLDQRLTTDRVALDRGMSHFDTTGTTALYDAVAASADELAKSGKNRREVLLIITDGADNASRLNLQEAIRRVQNLGGPVVYPIGLLFDAEKDESDKAKNALETLSEDTGGIAYFPSSLQDVYGIASQVATDIREQYVVDYHSSTPFSLGGYRSIRVEASAQHHGALFVRTKRGYYAKAEQQARPAQEADQQQVIK